MTKEDCGQAYQRGYESSVRFLGPRGVARDLVGDVAQAAWVKDWERLSQLRNESMVTTWVNAIAINVYRSILRSAKPSGALTDFTGRAELNVAMIDVVRILVTAHEIAEKHGVTVAAIRIRLLRARRAARFRAEKKPALQITREHHGASQAAGA
jgi:DNA-directed RNA polymerase specialized sigma24 family protein